ncbi:MAG: hypothetical protein LKM32_11565 [Chiayiivirga sp.]|uniref:hypothetical protein n=1 Tax=Chiayiivirga sp. TaxID=2041042 RepID=UPI0025C30715|nr:hypothetical protein [Chiayiivirga sp.]MCI1729987.1 hypothetical protein [Chiayiivirga sp.]
MDTLVNFQRAEPRFPGQFSTRGNIGGLSMQLAKLGAQIGWVDSGPALWDTNWVVSERSWLGQLLHALFGYDANPDAAQAAFYFVSLGAVCLVAAIRVGLLRDSSRA